MKRAAKIILVLFVICLLIYYFFPEKPLHKYSKVDSIVIIKSKNSMAVYNGNKVLKTYCVSIGRGADGRKLSGDDNRTPEGIYTVVSRNPSSGFYRSLNLSYPNREDLVDAMKRGADLGGSIEIHGLKNGLGFLGKFHRLFNWTQGCVAVTNPEIDELYNAVNVATLVEIRK